MEVNYVDEQSGKILINQTNSLFIPVKGDYIRICEGLNFKVIDRVLIIQNNSILITLSKIK